jgi:hypothetical protein
MEDELSFMSSNGVWDLVEISDGDKKVCVLRKVRLMLSYFPAPLVWSKLAL